jgi:hypothetical protein
MEALDAALFPSIIRLTIKKQKRAELGFLHPGQKAQSKNSANFSHRVCNIFENPPATELSLLIHFQNYGVYILYGPRFYQKSLRSAHIRTR